MNEDLQHLAEDAIVIVEANEEHLLDTHLSVLKNFSQQPGIILSMSRPHDNLEKLYQEHGIDTSKFFIIDCATGKDGMEGNVQFIQSVSSLSEIAIAVDEQIEQGAPSFLFVDSVSTLLIYNRPEILAKFIHAMITKLRLKGIKGVLLGVQGEDNREIRAEILQLCDQVIKS